MEILPRGSLEKEQLNIILLCVFVSETQICITELLAVTAIRSDTCVYTCCLSCCSATASFVSRTRFPKKHIGGDNNDLLF